jgi:hypothetical protein
MPRPDQITKPCCLTLKPTSPPAPMRCCLTATPIWTSKSKFCVIG